MCSHEVKITKTDEDHLEIDVVDIWEEEEFVDCIPEGCCKFERKYWNWSN